MWIGFVVVLFVLAGFWWWVNYASHGKIDKVPSTLDSLKESAQRQTSRLQVGPDGLVGAV